MPLPVNPLLSPLVTSAWNPGPEQTDHNGQPLEPGRVYFAAPPPEIGEILSAHCTLKQGQAPNAILRVVLALLVALPAFALGWACTLAWNGEFEPYSTWFWIGLGVGTFAIAHFCFCFKRVCSYVGSEGFAIFTLKEPLDRPPTSSVFLFSQAEDLRTGSTRHYTNGIHTGTTYFCHWMDEKGKRMFKLDGKHGSADGIPKRHNPYWIASAAEKAWTLHKLPWVEAHVATQGYVPFDYGKGQTVRVGPGFLEFAGKSGTHRINKEDIKHIQLNSGRFDIQSKDTRWFSSKGKFSFPYESMSNARLFLVAMDRLLGYRF